MAYAIDTGGTRRAGATLLTSGTAATDCVVSVRGAGRSALAALGAQPPVGLARSLADFVDTHGAALDGLAVAFEALGTAAAATAGSAENAELRATAAFTGAPATPTVRPGP
ncbi:hypothetical protein [Intrasporangium sp. YIM S08009]|uniref:hypothetical protein n=1 Tax=Intrasporangium zincisolvens TaxID=3080018 RepID=UPI002B051F7A|nr:hypothetical protein [Intrasporangium sp. YIM S08009]